MAPKDIRFFLPEENQPKTKEKVKVKTLPTGYISSAGKIIFLAATIEELGIEPENTKFQVGTDQGKRKIKNLYLIPTDQSNAFAIVRTGRGYSLALDLILSKGGIDYAGSKHVFTASIFDHEGVAGYALAISPETIVEKAPYTGKPRGRKPKVEAEPGN
ncbi:hypothetical protein [Dyadobacter psychrotolerans]|uniref:Uncharacterized protein n=1 Tax=Dyadobacter psychrotolerans TaxID=2541721 RepID=A0A4R5D9S7_9BACT|nr:hypothetical protein [Dyadobacter psychrotolerans]TDE08690.1 hypothetical protein E0F88_32180 [Dyadobacter psychrotolerans]